MGNIKSLNGHLLVDTEARRSIEQVQKNMVSKPKDTQIHKQLVTDGEGNVVWGERLAWKEDKTIHQIPAEYLIGSELSEAHNGKALAIINGKVALTEVIDASVRENIRQLNEGLSSLTEKHDEDLSRLIDKHDEDLESINGDITALNERTPILQGGENPVNLLTEQDIDPTLTQEGKVADAKAVGKNISRLSEDIARNTAPPIMPTATGEIVTVSDSAHRPLAGLRLYGKTVLTGTPTPEAPVRMSNSGQGNIKVTVHGKSLFSVQAETITGYKEHVLDQPLPKGDYYITAEVTSNDTDISESYIYFYPASGPVAAMLAFARGVKQTKKITLTAPVINIRLLAASNIGTSAGDTCTWKNVMLALTAGAEFEEYKNGGAVTAITPDGLPGIPVSGGGNYTDENGQSWLSDVRDYGRGVDVKNTAVIVYDGSDDEKWAVNEENKTAADRYFGGHKPHVRGLCSHYTNANSGDRFYIGGSLTIYDQSITTESAWRTKLAANPMTVLYALATPIETPIPADELAAYRAMKSQYPHTTVINDSGVGMGMDYIADTKLYIDNKLAAIAAATL